MTCRKRAVEIMKETIVGRERLVAARKREDDFLARAVQQSDEAASKRQKLEESLMVLPSSAQVSGGNGVGITVSTPMPIHLLTTNGLSILEMTK